MTIITIADFHAWPQPTLAEFAIASQAKMAEDAETIQDLKEQLRVAIDAYHRGIKEDRR